MYARGRMFADAAVRNTIQDEVSGYTPITKGGAYTDTKAALRAVCLLNHAGWPSGQRRPR